MKSLVGYTGFVGQNLLLQGKFGALYNSKNIGQAFGTSPDCLYFCGIGAQKFLANTDPAADMSVIENAIANIKRINPKSVVLISTVDVYKNPVGVDEDSIILKNGLHAYGLNRLRLEQWVESEFKNKLIVRLPGLYGRGLKKNFIFDMITVIPSMIRDIKLAELDTAFLAGFYVAAGNGFYKLRSGISAYDRTNLRRYFQNCGFSALSFTDSRAVLQMYNLSCLYGHIETALSLGIEKLNIATAPVSAGELYRYVYGKDFVNELSDNPAHYDYRSKWAAEFGGSNGYILGKSATLDDIKKFVNDVGNLLLQ